jgi:hypothetical protein
MSDYQSVTIKSIEKKVITIEVVEDSHDSRALASIFDEGSRRGIDDGKERADANDWLKIGAMLLLGDKAMSGDIEAPDDEPPEPEHFVSDVTKVEATVIGEGSSENPRYRAVLRIELRAAKYAKVFEVGETFGAVADLGGDFDSCFG